MEFVANEGKQVEIEVDGNIYLRHAVQTRFITENDHYINIMYEYVMDHYQQGDFARLLE